MGVRRWTKTFALGGRKKQSAERSKTKVTSRPYIAGLLSTLSKSTGWSLRTVKKYSSIVKRLVLIEPSSMIWLKDNSLTFSFSKTDWFWKIIWGVKCKKFQNRIFARLQISIKSASLSMSKLRTTFQSCSLKYWPFGNGFWRINKTEHFETKRSF